MVKLAVLVLLCTVAHADEAKLDHDAKVSPAGLKAPAGFVKEQGVTWTDGDGDHYALFSRKEVTKSRSSYLQVDVYGGKAGKLALVRSVKDSVEDCEFDVTVQFIPGSVTVADVDGDHHSELMFAYVVGCRSDVSPDPMKLVVLEGNDKHILRGETRVQVSDKEYAGGTFEAEGFKDAPKLLAAAKLAWAKALAVAEK